MTEREVLEVIDRVVTRLAPKYRFGCNDIDDLRQEGRLEALRGLANYDNKRPLEAFLYTHVKNRLYNFKRNNYARIDPPCKNCPFFDPDYKTSDNQCTEFLNKDDCDKWAGWIKRNIVKKNINNPIDIGNVNDEHEEKMRCQSNIVSEISNKDILDYINDNLDIKYRTDYLKLLQGVSITKTKKEVLFRVISQLIEDRNGKEKDDI